MANGRKAVLLDRDGVLNRLITERGPRETPVSASELQLLPRVTEALARLKQAGFVLPVVTNQPNVAKGKTTLNDHRAIEAKLHRLVAPIKLDGVYTCLHHPDAEQVERSEYLVECDCRKPFPGLIYQAEKELGLDLQRSWLVGDNDTDILAGVRAGIPADQLIFIGSISTLANVVAPSLLEAAAYILTHEKKAP